ncbi:MAG: tetratricopeptide repeat protein, partial [Humidesulfovibrio sp.]|nr:tetratricopeptide repeat protein [Humidesulfovibrio sp.]
GKYAEAARVLRAALPASTAAESPAPRPSLSPSVTQATPQAPLAVGSPEAAHTRAVLGFTLLRLNQLPEAEEQFTLVRQSPDIQSVGLLGSGWAAFAHGRTSAAVELFAEALAKNSGPASTWPDMLRESVPADARLGQGLIALGRGRASEATTLLEAASAGPDLLGSAKELFLALGDARALAGDAKGALAAWAEAPRRASSFPGDAPRDELARLKTARLLESKGEAAQALALFSGLSGGQHYQAEALLGQARVLLAQGRASEALSALRRLVALEPTLAEPLGRTIAADPLLRPLNKDWGLAYFHRADYLEALAKLTAYLDDVDPKDYASLMGMGWGHLRLGHGLQAWDAFADAARVRANGTSPASAEPLAGVGAAALSLGRVVEARGILAKALAAEPNNAVALNTMGHLELSQGNAQKALEHFRAALSARPDYVDSRLAAAKILFDRAEYDAAAAEYFRLATQEKRSVAAWNGLGWARLRLGQLDDALTAFAEARRLNPSLPAAAYGLGITLARLGQPDKASQRLAEAIFLNPDFAATPELLELMRSRPEYAELFLEMGEAYARKLYPTTAAPFLEEYLRQNPNSRPGRRALAWASFWAGQEDKAHALFQTLITVNKDDPDAHLGDGLALLSRDHLDKAEPHLREA